MKVLLVSESFPPKAGGSGWSTYQLSKSLKKFGYEVFVAKLGGKENKYKEQEIICLSKSPLKARKEIDRIVKEMGIDVVHSQHMLSTIAISKVKARKVATIRDYWPLNYKGTLFNNKEERNYEPSLLEDMKCIWNENRLLIKILFPLAFSYLELRTWYARKCLKKMDKIICVSDFVKKKMEKKFSKEKLITIHNIIDVSFLENIPAKIFENPTLVFVGKLEVPKGPHLLDCLTNRDEDILFIGSGEMEKELKEKFGFKAQFIDQLSNEEVLSYMKGANRVILPSLWHEPLGRTILEALGVKANVLVSNRGGSSEIIPERYLFDGSREDLLSKIDLTYPLPSLEEFSEKKVIAKYKQAY